MDVIIYEEFLDNIIVSFYSNTSNTIPNSDLQGCGGLIKIKTNHHMPFHMIQRLSNLIVDIELKMDDFTSMFFYHCKLMGAYGGNTNYLNNIAATLDAEYAWKYYIKSSGKKPKKSIPNWLKEGF